MVFIALCFSALMARASGASSITIQTYTSSDCSGDATTTSETATQVMTRNGYDSCTSGCCTPGLLSMNEASDCNFNSFLTNDCSGDALTTTPYVAIGCTVQTGGSWQGPSCASGTTNNNNGGTSNNNNGGTSNNNGNSNGASTTGGGTSSITIQTYTSSDCSGDATTTSETATQVMTRNGYDSCTSGCCTPGLLSMNEASACNFNSFLTNDCSGDALTTTPYVAIGCTVQTGGSWRGPSCATATANNNNGGTTNNNNGGNSNNNNGGTSNNNGNSNGASTTGGGTSSITIQTYTSSDCSGDATTTSETATQVMTRNGYDSCTSGCCTPGLLSMNEASACNFNSFLTNDCSGDALTTTPYVAIGCTVQTGGSWRGPSCATATDDSSATKMLAVVPFFAVAIGTMV